MTGQKEPLKPLTPGKIGIYVCGPTVYSFIHIGNARTFCSFDVIVRYLRYCGFDVKYVRNYTDVDDKIINASRVVGRWTRDGKDSLLLEADGSGTFEGKKVKWNTDGASLTLVGVDAEPLKYPMKLEGGQMMLEPVGAPLQLSRQTPEMSAVELSARFVREFETDVAALHLLPPDVTPKVSEHMPEIVAIIEKLVAKDIAYASKGDVYFQVSKYPQYAKLSKRNLEDMQAGERVSVGEQKREPLDFALWKAAKPGEPSWDSPWGKGRPGWHIECSAMSSKYLGDTFDMHGGALDLIFPHHENEIAQSEAASGKTLCNCWMHAGFLDLEGAKMSKSLGNVVRLRDALEKVDAEALRYFFLSTHYRSPIAFNDKSLADAEARLEYFYETLKKVDERLAGKEAGAGPTHGEPGKWLKQFEEAMDDDFNFAGALSAVSGLFAAMNELTDKPPVKDKALVARTLHALRGMVGSVSGVLGLFEEPPAAWLLRRRDRQVKTKGIDPTRVETLIAARTTARAEKNFQEADRVRGELKTLGVEIMDTPGGTTWKVTA
ncbi:MAG: cysteine--tRNA ligase [Myxococcaceae bacterium]|nr:cysteine--tRNA ligase [Myxococcaceae bacterium]